MNVLIQFLAFIITILVLVSFHEAGHFLVAKLLGVKVLRFSIGFGKPLTRFFDKQGTEYVLALIPLGGYVKLLDEREVIVPPSEKSRAFNRQPLWGRILVVLAGPLTNILFAILAFWLMFMIGVKAYRPVIGLVQENSITAEAGLKAGDEIIKIDGIETPTLQKAVIAIIRRLGEKTQMTMTVISSHSATPVLHTLNLSHWSLNPLHPDPLTSLGFKPSLATDLLKTQQYSFAKAFQFAVNESWQFMVFNAIVLKKMVLGQLSLSSLGGPISIFQTADSAFRQGISVFLGFLGLISLMLAFINILPIPGLDGGHLLNYLIEAVIRRSLSLKYEIISVQIGMFLLILLMVFATFNDILRLFMKF